MADLDVVKRRRIAAKGWLSRVNDKLEDIIKRCHSKIELEDAIGDFETRLENYDVIQAEVEQLIPLEELDADIDCASAFRDEKKASLIKAKECLSTLQNDSTAVEDNKSISGSVDDRQKNDSNTKLPTLHLEKFSGNYTAWQTFWDKFSAVVDSSKIPDINKFTYLQSLLDGEAASAIKGLSLTASNYMIAKETLKKRFGRPERIIFGHIQELLKNTGSSSREDLTSLWRLHDDIQGHVRCLHNLGIDGDRFGVFLTPLILHQLPSTVRLEWARVGEGREGDLDFLLTFLGEEINRRERSRTFDYETKVLEPQKDRSTTKKSGTASALLTQASSREKRLCVFCRGAHYSDKCASIQNLNFEDRKDRIKKLGLCFLCLGSHLAKGCSKKCYFCKGMHHAVLCKRRVNDGQRAAAGHEADPLHVGVSYAQSKEMTTLMQVVHARISGSEVSIMFDSGSDRSFVTKECVKKLNLGKVGRETLQYSCFGDFGCKEECKDVYELLVNGARLKLICMKTICTTMFRSAVPKVILDQFNDVPFVEDYSKGRSVKIDMLIGLDYYWSLITSQKGNGSVGLIAQQTVFGWMLSGRHSMGKTGDECSRSHVLFVQTPLADSQVRKQWDLESIGISVHEVSRDKEADLGSIMASFSEKIDFREGRYVVTLPWKEHSKDLLLDNKEIAERRLSCLDRKLMKDPTLKERYDSVLNEYETEGIIKEVQDDEIREKNAPVFYLPHRPVVKEDSLTTKVRPVFDASCKATNGISLNDCMEIGPKLIPDLVQILVRFRKWNYGLTADIQKAFLQIKLNESDQDVHRFLWTNKGKTRTMKFERVCFGNACSPFLLNATIKYHLSKFESSPALKELETNLYVDDWITGADSEKEIQKMKTEAKDVMSQGGFILTKWNSSCPEVDTDPVKTFDGLKDQETTKVLGLSWNTEDDAFVFKTLPVPESCVFTKRLLLSTTARLFDPIGLMTPFSITLKILFQDAWRKGFDWDETLPEDIQHILSKWMNDLEKIRKWKIPRRIVLGTWIESTAKELVVFADASEKAYGCCVYLKTTADKEVTHIGLIMSRVRVAPLKKITLPRMELLAALLAARLLRYVSVALDLEHDLTYTCWSDSQIALSWIKGDPIKWKQFVRNRVIEIQQLTNPSRWKHCSGESNPADLLTRGVSAETLVTSSKWLTGPDWLKNKDDRHEDLYDETEVSHKELDMALSYSTCAVEVQSLPFLEHERFSSFGKLLRVLALVLRFVKKIRKVDVSDSDILSEAKNVLFRSLQHQHYAREVGQLMKGDSVRKGSPLGNLSPFLGEDGLLRVGGRLESSQELTYEEKHPIILPRCHVTVLLVRSQHFHLKHAGVNLIMTSLRNKYWIVSLRPIAKRVVRFCVSCQRQDSRLMDQNSGLLPEKRISQSLPFSIVGIDYAGPLFCSDLPGKKLYILLFTCAVTRAVHLELVDSLNAYDFFLALKRFASRRAIPAVIYSDNAQTFRKAQSLLNESIGHEVIQWRKQPALAPWWGGFYERMVRSVKSGIRKSVGKRSIPRKELETVLVEVEACINSRPLTGTAENENYLTPSHFLIGRGCPLSPSVVTDLNPIFDLTVLAKNTKDTLDKFWEIWRLEYIRSLPPARTSKRANVGLREGALVLVQDTCQKRMLWNLGRVVELFKGNDGSVRAAQIKTAKNSLVRPIQRLVLLELDHPNQDMRGSSIQDTPSLVSQSDISQHLPLHSLPAASSRSGRTIKPRLILDL